jgi:hypothetical protein
LDKLKDLTSSFTTVTVERDNTTGITTLGAKLDELNSLCIVPTTEAVRIAKYITDEIVGDNGVKAIVPSEHINNPAVKPVYDDAISDVTALNTKYVNYLANPDATVFDFANDFAVITNCITEVDAALDGVGA